MYKRQSRPSSQKLGRLMEYFVARVTARAAAELLEVNRKVAVFGLLKRGGTVYTAIIPNAKPETLLPIVEKSETAKHRLYGYI